jgi:FHS family L-fucose permease-like MFS transporter
VGAEVAIGSYIVNYFLDLDITTLVAGSGGMSWLAEFLSGSGITEMGAAQLAGTFVFFYWGGAMVGRFLGAWLQTFIKPGKLLGTYAIVNIGLLLVSMNSAGLTAVWSLLAIGLFNSIMFPTIFTLAIEHLGEHTAQGSGILCTAIVGGAIIPPLYGAMADSSGLQTAFIIPVVCYAYISYYGFKGHKA